MVKKISAEKSNNKNVVIGIVVIVAISIFIIFLNSKNDYENSDKTTTGKALTPTFRPNIATSCNADAVCETKSIDNSGKISSIGNIKSMGIVDSKKLLVGENPQMQGWDQAKAIIDGQLVTKELVVTEGPIRLISNWYLWSDPYIGTSSYLLVGPNAKGDNLKPGDIRALGKVEANDLEVNDINAKGALWTQFFRTTQDAQIGTYLSVAKAPVTANGIGAAGIISSESGIKTKNFVEIDGCKITVNKQSKSLAVDCSSCTDGEQNQDETDIDCGGIICEKKCENDKKCIVNNDCQSNTCLDNICYPIGTKIETLTSNSLKDGWTNSIESSTSDDWIGIGKMSQDSNVIQRGFIFFDTNSIPSSAEIKDVILKVRASKGYPTCSGDLEIIKCNYDPLDSNDFSACESGLKNTQIIRVYSSGDYDVEIDKELIEKGTTTQFMLKSPFENCARNNPTVKMCMDSSTASTYNFCNPDLFDPGTIIKPTLIIKYNS